MQKTATRLELSPVHLLHRAGQCASDLFAAEMGQDGLTPRQFAVLLTIAGNEGISQTGLVRFTGIDRSTLADVVRRMIKKGLIQRKRTKRDARAYAVKLTEGGWRLLRSADPTAKSVDERLLQPLTAQQRTMFLEMLDTIVRSFDTETVDEDGAA